MHANAMLLQRLFTGLNQHDHEAMAACYHLNATFTDIAFNLKGRKEIHSMWHMLCRPEGRTSDIRAMFQVVYADDRSGWVNVFDDYTFGETGRKVTNVIDSHFYFNDGLISQQHDFCDPMAWADMALGGVSSVAAGRLHWLRSFKARQMLHNFVKGHPEYRV